MPKPNEVQSNVSANVKVEEIPGIVANLRKAFNRDKTRPKSWRVSQLNALNKLLTENRDELARSLFEDMHCSPFEGKSQKIWFSDTDFHSCSVYATACYARTGNLRSDSALG